MSRSSFVVALLAMATLAGCSTASTPADPAGASDLPPSSIPAPPPAAAVACDRAKAQWALGQSGDAALLEKARIDSGAKIARILKADQAVTMEYNESRLNLRVDAKGVVNNVNCG
jgi:hypothetical protein